MMPKTKTFVEFVFPGFVFSESSTHEVESRDMQTKLPERAYAFRFFDVTETQVGDETLRGTPKNFSPMYYPGASAIAAIDVPNMFPGGGNDILRSNVAGNHMRGVIKTCTGTVVEWSADDVVLP